MISFGPLKVTQQAFFIALIGLAISIFMAAKGLAMPALIVLAGAFLAAYNANCTVIGHCDMWAWTLFIIYALNMFMLTRITLEKKGKLL